jgi:hypothetical protein
VGVSFTTEFLLRTLPKNCKINNRIRCAGRIAFGGRILCFDSHLCLAEAHRPFQQCSGLMAELILPPKAILPVQRILQAKRILLLILQFFLTVS